ncbi:hypothetical protein AB4Y85_16175 [Microvirga sp. 2YAF29]|uniref:hypothetical protein n=1 Tax=Microvirga sp. 2YAF29 TaxID=3233031 RepID=UPI003F9C3B4D
MKINGEPELLLLPNGYSVEIATSSDGCKNIAGIRRFDTDFSRLHVPFLATWSYLFQTSIFDYAKTLFLKDSRVAKSEFERTISRIAALPQATWGASVCNWDTSPLGTISAAIETLANAKIRDVREQAHRWRKALPEDYFDYFQPSYRRTQWLDDLDKTINVEWIAKWGRIRQIVATLQEYGSQVVDPDLAFADVVVENAAIAYVCQRIESDLGLLDHNWMHGVDLTFYIHRSDLSKAAKLKVAQYLGQRLIGKPLEGKARDAADCWRGPSRLYSRLFADPAARSQHPEAWQAMFALARSCVKNKTLAPVVLWHGFDDHRRESYLSAPRGSELYPHASFTATSLSSAIAIEHGSINQFGRAHIARIRLPKGSPALFIGGREHEVLLPPGTRLVVASQMSVVRLPDNGGKDHDVTIMDIDAVIPTTLELST